jgi:hypothetical protein
MPAPLGWWRGSWCSDSCGSDEVVSWWVIGGACVVIAALHWWIWRRQPDDPTTLVWLLRLLWRIVGVAGAAVGLSWSVRRWLEEES